MKHYWGYKIVMDVCDACADQRMETFDRSHPDIANEFGAVKEEWIHPRHEAIWGKQHEEPIMMFDYGRDHIRLCANHIMEALEAVIDGKIDEGEDVLTSEFEFRLHEALGLDKTKGDYASDLLMVKMGIIRAVVAEAKKDFTLSEVQMALSQVVNFVPENCSVKKHLIKHLENEYAKRVKWFGT